MYLFQHADFPDFITQVADRDGTPAAIVEKDYWVTYVLYRLQRSEFSGQFLFKGGTSLSKGWSLIQRFSEDIDLLFLPDGLGRNARRRRLEEVRDFVAGLEGLTHDEENAERRAGNESRTACYRYERRREHAFGTLRPFLKLEMGFRGGPEPHTNRTIQSLIGIVLEQEGQATIAEDVPGFDVPVLHPKRTLVEKLFAIHAAAASGEVIGQSRHYYDIYKLLQVQEFRDFVGTEEYIGIRQSVHDYSVAEFPNSPIIEPARLHDSPGFQLADNLRRALQREMETSEMIFGDRPTMQNVLTEIDRIRGRI